MEDLVFSMCLVSSTAITIRGAQGAPPSGIPVGRFQLGRTAGVLLVLAYIAVGIVLRRDTGLKDSRGDSSTLWVTQNHG